MFAQDWNLRDHLRNVLSDPRLARSFVLGSIFRGSLALANGDDLIPCLPSFIRSFASLITLAGWLRQRVFAAKSAVDCRSGAALLLPGDLEVEFDRHHAPNVVPDLDYHSMALRAVVVSH